MPCMCGATPPRYVRTLTADNNMARGWSSFLREVQEEFSLAKSIDREFRAVYESPGSSAAAARQEVRQQEDACMLAWGRGPHVTRPATMHGVPLPT